jgi:hypothetical protein
MIAVEAETPEEAEDTVDDFLTGGRPTAESMFPLQTTDPAIVWDGVPQKQDELEDYSLERDEFVDPIVNFDDQLETWGAASWKEDGGFDRFKQGLLLLESYVNHTTVMQPGPGKFELVWTVDQPTFAEQDRATLLRLGWKRGDVGLSWVFNFS